MVIRVLGRTEVPPGFQMSDPIACFEMTAEIQAEVFALDYSGTGLDTCSHCEDRCEYLQGERDS